MVLLLLRVKNFNDLIVHYVCLKLLLGVRRENFLEFFVVLDEYISIHKS